MNNEHRHEDEVFERDLATLWQVAIKVGLMALVICLVLGPIYVIGNEFPRQTDGAIAELPLMAYPVMLVWMTTIMLGFIKTVELLVNRIWPLPGTDSTQSQAQKSAFQLKVMLVTIGWQCLYVTGLHWLAHHQVGFFEVFSQ